PSCTQMGLNLTPTFLDFGAIPQSQSDTMLVVISNNGCSPANWTADTGGTSWLSLAPSSGTIPPGGQQTVNMTADTSGLATGNYTPSVNFSFNCNGEIISAKVGVSLIVAPPTTPTWSVSPTSLDVTSCSGGTTWTCTVTLTEDASSQVDINWTSSSDQSQVIF